MAKRTVLLIHGDSGPGCLGDQLSAAGCEVVAIPATAGKLRLPLMALPDMIVLHAIAVELAEEMIERLRAVGFEMPAVVVRPGEVDAGDSSHRYTIDAGTMDVVAATDWLVQLAMHPAGPESSSDRAEAGGDCGEEQRVTPPVQETASITSRSNEDQPDGAPRGMPSEAPIDPRARRRRAGAAPLGRRFQVRGTPMEPVAGSVAPVNPSQPRSSCVAHSQSSPSSPSSSPLAPRREGAKRPPATTRHPSPPRR